MHKDDQMTPNERLQAFMTGQEMDRILTIPMIVSIAHRVLGMSHKEKRGSAENQAAAQIACYERFGCDMLILEYGLHGIGMALGNEMTDPEDSVPAIYKHVLSDLKDIDKLDFNKTTKENDPWLKLNLDALKICIERVGNEIPTGVLLPGPFTAVSSVYPTDLLLRATRKDKESVHKLLRLCTDALKDIYLDFVKEGGMIVMCDPIASGTLLKQKQYQEFVEPYATELMQCVHDNKGMCCYHICGNTAKIIEDMVDTGCDMMSIDNLVDIGDTVARVGNRVPILGNVAPVDVLMLGDETMIFESVKKCIKDGHKSPKGYILASGCDITQNVPLENVDAMMRAARKYGKYPINEDLLQ